MSSQNCVRLYHALKDFSAEGNATADLREMYRNMGLKDFAKAMGHRIMRMMLKGMSHAEKTGRIREIGPEDTIEEGDYLGREMQDYMRMMSDPLSDDEF